MRAAVFLDRDGVLNRSPVRDGSPHPPRRVADVERLAGVETACRRLAEAGWLLVVVTNQPDVARGTSTAEEVQAINDAVVAGLPVAAIAVCPHDDADGCPCRKPRPGMLLELADRFGIDLAGSVMVGDRWRDVEAGRAAGTRTIFIDRHYEEALRSEPDHVVADLPAAASLILDGPAVT